MVILTIKLGINNVSIYNFNNILKITSDVSKLEVSIHFVNGSNDVLTMDTLEKYKEVLDYILQSRV